MFSRFLLLFLMVFAGAVLVSWADSNARLIKKVDKSIIKTWDIENVSKREIGRSDEVSAENERQFYELWQEDSLIGYAVLNRSYGCRVGGCAVYSPTTLKEGSYDPFYYSILTDTHFSIKNVTILEYYSEYGYEITSKRWLSQFIGKLNGEIKYEENIDAISGATISVKSLIDDVNETLLELEKVVN